MKAVQATGSGSETNYGKRLATLQALAAMRGLELTICDDLAYVMVKNSGGAMRVWTLTDAERALTAESEASA